MGQHRLRLRGLQRAQGRPDAEAGAHEPDPQAGEAEAQPDAEPEIDPPQVSVLADVPGERLLVGGVEVKIVRERLRQVGTGAAARGAGPLLFYAEGVAKYDTTKGRGSRHGLRCRSLTHR